MDQRNKITEMLKNYRYYKLAIAIYNDLEDGEFVYYTDPYMTAAPARMTLYSETPIGRGDGSRPPRLSGRWLASDVIDFTRYKQAINRIDSALDLLNNIERSVIILKWMDGLTLEEIGRKKNYGRDWAKKVHQRAFKNLEKSLRFDDVPKIDKDIVPKQYGKTAQYGEISQ